MNEYRNALNDLPFDPDQKEKTIRMLKDYAHAKAKQPVRPMWQHSGRVAVAVACAVVVLLGAVVLWRGQDSAVPPVKPDEGAVVPPPSTTAPTTATVPLTRPTGNLEGVGNSDWKRVTWATGKQSGPEFIADYLVLDGLVSKEHFKENWCSQFEFYADMYSDPKLINGVRSEAEYTVYHYIKEYNISRDYVEKCVLAVYEQTKEQNPKNPLVVYTKEEIDAMFAPTPAAFIQLFANPCAIVVNNVIYTPEWLENHSVEEWTQTGITKEAVEAKLSIWEEYFLYSSNQNAALKEKVATFCE